MPARRDHKAQLLVCHQKIAARHMDRRSFRATDKFGLPGFVPGNQRFCDLAAYAWCYSCDMYVCDIHLNSRHRDHDHYVEFPTVRRRAAGPAG